MNRESNVTRELRYTRAIIQNRGLEAIIFEKCDTKDMTHATYDTRELPYETALSGRKYSSYETRK